MAKTQRSALKSGQRLKKGKVGKTTYYITRAKALRKLQVPLKDFRRLCILKGIFPREAPHGKDKSKIYYHIKDINYMQHEPILDKYRQLKVLMRKRARFIGRYEKDQADALEAPVLKLDHLVRERYPTSIDAIKDLDDPLNMLYLFSTLPTKVYQSFTVEDVELVRRLTKEWYSIVEILSALRKVFVSIKGYYFQAQIHNIPVTWLVPHQAMQNVPKNVDFDIMTTFLQFYSTMSRCVNFKLAKDQGKAYPLQVLTEEEQIIEFMKQFPLQDGTNKNKSTPTKGKNASKDKKKTAAVELPKSIVESALKSEATAGSAASRSRRTTTTRQSKKNIDDGMAEGSDDDDEISDDDIEVTHRSSQQKALDDDNTTIAQFQQLDPSQSLQDIEKEASSGVFRNTVFLIGREVSFEPIAFVIRCGGGIAIQETALVSAISSTSTSSSPLDYQKWLKHPAITHQVIDRPTIQQDQQLSTRVYIQPQWVFDSFNMRAQLPVQPYTVGEKLPPHLSPFVDNVKENYIPAQLNQLRAWVGLAPLKESVLTRISDEQKEKDLEKRREEQSYLLDMQKELEQVKQKSQTSVNAKGKRKAAVAAEAHADDDDDEIELDVDGEYDGDDDGDEDDEIIVDDVSDDEFDEETYLNDGDSDDDDEEIISKPRPAPKPTQYNPRDNDKQLAKIMMKKKDKRLHNRMMFGISERAKKSKVLHEKREAAEKGIENPKLSYVKSRLKRQR